MLNLYQQYIAVIIKGEVHTSNRSYQTCTLHCLGLRERTVHAVFFPQVKDKSEDAKIVDLSRGEEKHEVSHLEPLFKGSMDEAS